MSSRKFSDVLVLILNSSQRLPSCIFKNEIFYNNNLKKCPKRAILSIKKSFVLFPCQIGNQQGTGGYYIKL